jgi:hypothetical protein
MPHSLEPAFISDAHYKAFGRIIQAFVKVEIWYALLLERILKIESASASLMFAAYSYDSLKNLLKAVITESSIPEADRAEGIKYVDKVNDKATLRNNVAHNAWKPGRKDGNIKPMVLKTKGSVFILGTEHNEKEWTAAELDAEADEILMRAVKVVEFFGLRGIKIGDDKKAD